MAVSASTSVTARGIRLILPFLLAAGLAAGQWQGRTIGSISLETGNKKDRRLAELRELLALKTGDPFNHQQVRKSIENLYRTGIFENIEVQIEPVSPAALNVRFIMNPRVTIGHLYFQNSPVLLKFNLKKAIRALHSGQYLEKQNIDRAAAEIQEYLRSRGFFKTAVQYQIVSNPFEPRADIHFNVMASGVAQIMRIEVSTDNPEMKKTFEKYFVNENEYVPFQFEKKIEKIKKLLKKKYFYSSEIKIQENFLNPSQTRVDLRVDIQCRLRYVFTFSGFQPRKDLIEPIWEKQVFEKWAEEESRARLLNVLKNDGYLNAEVAVSISETDGDKRIHFTIDKKQRYALGKITISGNRVVTTDKIEEVISTDDLIFEKFLWLRLNSLLVDLEALKLFYYYLGYPAVKVAIHPSFVKNKADIEFAIDEGRRYSIESVLFSGNRRIATPILDSLLRMKPGRPFVQQQANEDLETLQNHYWKNGYDDAGLSLEISEGEAKSVFIQIKEGDLKLMGNLIISGASLAQKSLIKKLFPLKSGQPFNRSEIENFRSEIEKSAIFNDLRIEKIPRGPTRIDVLIHATPDRSRFYGFGIGWDERLGPRGTVEYQEKNLFNLASSFSAIVQIGLKERRAIISYDTPYFFRNKITSSFQFWEENETYTSYRFNRLGIGGSFIKKFDENLYLVGSLKWYRTTLTELHIPEYGVDRLDVPFDTTALTLSIGRENRDDPLNPRRGDFFSGDLKIGLPLFEKNYTFFKFFWSYQKHLPISKAGVFSFSIRNGFGFGDMSVSERFFAGGSHSFRGAGIERLGSIYQAPEPVDSPDYPLGGNALILFNAEATFPATFLPITNLYYSVFADVGNIFWRSSDFDITRMERAVGLGIKYKTAMGPLRIDFAWNLRKAAEKRFLIQVGIGNAF